MTYVQSLGAKAKAAEYAASSAPSKLKNDALKAIAGVKSVRVIG